MPLLSCFSQLALSYEPGIPSKLVCYLESLIGEVSNLPLQDEQADGLCFSKAWLVRPRHADPGWTDALSLLL